MQSILERIEFDFLFSELRKKGAKKMGVQLPDGLKHKSKEIVRRIEERGYEVIVSGSSSFGACDVDLQLKEEVDALVHLAHTPIFETDEVIYVPYFYDYSFENIEQYLDEIEEREIALAGTAQYAWKFDEFKIFLENKGFNVFLGEPKGRVKLKGQILGCNFSVLRDTNLKGSYSTLFIGDGLFHPKGVAMYTERKVYQYSPLNDEFRIIDEEEIEMFRKERYIQISKAINNLRDGVGIIVSSKLGQKRLELAERIRLEIINKGYYADVLFFDEISPEKIMNFSYGVYVNTACPRITYEDFTRYSKPIISPTEIRMILGKINFERLVLDELR